MFFKKKAVSPLIATVLLVMITVSIGAAVMVVIQSLNDTSLSSVEQQQQLIKCGADVSVGLLTVGTSYRICVNSTTNLGTFAIYAENKGLRDIEDWRFTSVSDTVNDTSTCSNSGLAKGNIKGYRFTFGKTGTIAKIKLSPKITGGASNPFVTCTLPNLEWDSDELASFDECNTTTWASASSMVNC